MGKNSEKKDKIKIQDLLERITEGATSNKTSISEVLRLCLRLGRLLQNNDLVDWALSELNGYENKDILPDYRVLDSPVTGHFSGSFGSSIRNAHIPRGLIEEKHREVLFTNYMTEPVVELEQLIRQGKGSDLLRSFWSGDEIAYYQSKEIYQGMVLSSAWRTLTKATISGILDTIRTRMLELTLNIKEEFDFENINKFGDNGAVINSRAEKVSQIFHNTIYAGNVAVGNVGDTTQQSIQIESGDIEGLKNYLKDLGLTKELIKDLDEALDKDGSVTNRPGPATRKWLSKVKGMIKRGSFSVATNAAGSLISTALRQYLGLGN